LIIDQFKEIFSFIDNPNTSNPKAEAQKVANIILNAIKDLDNQVYIALTMRSDFLGRCTEFEDLPESLNKAQYLIPRMTGNQLAGVIREPISKIEGSISDELVNFTLQDFFDNHDQLPILQHAKMRTLEFWNSNSKKEQIDIRHDHAIGGMENALSNHIDEAFENLNYAHKGI
jgi:hypothetical protein